MDVAVEARGADARGAGADAGAPSRYRPDIQGLRAVAVLLVVAAHAGLPLPGGFVGVDVFFVVSGFVIAGEIVAGLDADGSYRLRDFYARRARRLLPTLAAVTAVTLAVGVLLLDPFSSLDLAVRTAGAATAFVSNVYLYRHVGYFDIWQDGRNPFVHLWSLSVEEQFYLVFPGAVLLAWRAGRGQGVDAARRFVAVGVTVASMLSLAVAWLLVSGRGPDQIQAPVRLAFYAAPTRAWEFGAGILLALGARTVDRVPSRLAMAGAVVGTAAIAWTVLTLDPLDPFPGLAAVPVVLGTALLVVAGRRSAPVASILSVRPLRWVGDRSYGWYLWHWPAIVYARILWPGSGWPAVGAALLALGLAAITYCAFEDRIRRDRSIVGRRALRLAAVCTAISVVALVGSDVGVRTRLGLHQPIGWLDFPHGHDVGCVLFNRDLANTWLSDRCTTRTPDASGTLLVLGDEYADGVATATVLAAATRHRDVAEWTRSACPFLGAVPVGYPRCDEWQREAMDLVDRLHPDAVIVANDGPSYVDDLRDGTTIAGRGGGRPGSRRAAVHSWARGLDTLLARLRSRGIPVLVVAPAPDYREAFPGERFSLLRSSTSPPTVARSTVVARRLGVVRAERAVVDRRPGVAYLDPLSVLCGPSTCTPFRARDDRWLQFDRSKLTVAGGQELAKVLGPALDRLLGAP